MNTIVRSEFDFNYGEDVRKKKILSVENFDANLVRISLRTKG